MGQSPFLMASARNGRDKDREVPGTEPQGSRSHFGVRGVRGVRFPDRGKGKSGAYRVITISAVETFRCFF